MAMASSLVTGEPSNLTLVGMAEVIMASMAKRIERETFKRFIPCGDDDRDNGSGSGDDDF